MVHLAGIGERDALWSNPRAMNNMVHLPTRLTLR
jgi:hypothetical protein